ncbi:MAG: hypothetical protein FJZ01_17260 [Candidatus Sericytochromatia bacterium]|nr:hypothetical protein [Candidatus Tanganyikabacteria bacterium]
MSTGLILEGVVGTGKSTLFRHLQDHPAFVSREAKLALPETYTERAIEHLEVKDLEASLLLLTRITDIVGGLNRTFSESKFGRGDHAELALAFLLERFHLTHAAMFNEGRFAAYRSVDEVLRFLGAKLVVCVLDDAAFPERIATTRRERNQLWNDYLDERIASRTATMPREEVDRRVVAHYVAQQKAMLAMARQSLLPTLEIDTTRGDWLMYAEQAIRFWGLV